LKKLYLIYFEEDLISRNAYQSFRVLLDDSKYQIVENPEIADLIIVFEHNEDFHFKSIPAHSIIKRYFRKCYVFSEMDKPLGLLPGVYTCLKRSCINSKFLISYAYISYSKITGLYNPFLEEFENKDMERNILFSFVGRRSNKIRIKMFNHHYEGDDIAILDTTDYNHWDKDPKRQQGKKEQAQIMYAEIARRSLFALCPRGDGHSSIRIYEMMRIGCVPVIISDYWDPPAGPNWEEFSLRVPMKDYKNIRDYVTPYIDKAEEMGKLAQKAYYDWFAADKSVDQIVSRIESMPKHGPFNIMTNRILWFPRIWAYILLMKLKEWKFHLLKWKKS